MQVRRVPSYIDKETHGIPTQRIAQIFGALYTTVHREEEAMCIHIQVHKEVGVIGDDV